MSAKTGEGVEEILEAIVDHDPPARGRPGRATASAGLRLAVRPVPRRHRLRAGGRRRASKGPPLLAMQAGTRADIDELGFFGPDDAGRVPHRGRGGLRDHRCEGRLAAAGRRHPHPSVASGRGAAARLPRGQADGVLRALPRRHGPLRGPTRRARPAGAERRRPELRAGDEPGARVRLPVRLPGAAHMDIVRERLERENGLELLATTPNVPGGAHGQLRGGGALAGGRMPDRDASPRFASRTSAPRSSAPRITWARSWSSARTGAGATST